MDESKRKHLEDAGRNVGSAQDFLGLSDEEAAFVELKLALSESLRERAYPAGDDPDRTGPADRIESVAGGQDGGK